LCNSVAFGIFYKRFTKILHSLTKPGSNSDFSAVRRSSEQFRHIENGLIS